MKRIFGLLFNHLRQQAWMMRAFKSSFALSLTLILILTSELCLAARELEPNDTFGQANYFPLESAHTKLTVCPANPLSLYPSLASKYLNSLPS